MKKRGRQSTGGAKSTQDTSTKRQRTSKAGRKSNGALEQDVDHGALVGYSEVGEDNWKPPTAKPGSWDPLVQSVDTVVRESSDGNLWAYLIWNEKNEKGRFYRSKAQLPTIYKACPQRVRYTLNALSVKLRMVELTDLISDASFLRKTPGLLGSKRRRGNEEYGSMSVLRARATGWICNWCPSKAERVSTPV